MQSTNSEDAEDPNENNVATFNDTSQSSSVTIPLISDNEINSNFRSLNHKQRELFEVINKWARDCVKNVSCQMP